jgi:hypothetical protein
VVFSVVLAVLLELNMRIRRGAPIVGEKTVDHLQRMMVIVPPGELSQIILIV